MKTSLFNNNNATIYYDFILINGLYVVTTLKYIKRNCRNFNLPRLETEMEIFSATAGSVIEIKCSRHLRLQYLLKKELDIDELKLISEDVLPSEGKRLIIKAYAQMMNYNL